MEKFISDDGRLEVCYEMSDSDKKNYFFKIIRKEIKDDFEYEMITEKKIDKSEVDISYYALSKKYLGIDAVFHIYGEYDFPSIDFIYPIIRKNKNGSYKVGTLTGRCDEVFGNCELTIQVGDFYWSFSENVSEDGVEYTFNDTDDRDKISNGNGFTIIEDYYQERVKVQDDEEEESFYENHSMLTCDIFGKNKSFFRYVQDITTCDEELVDGNTNELLLYSHDGVVYDANDEEVNFGKMNIFERYIKPKMELVEGFFDQALNSFPEISSSIFELDHKIPFYDQKNLTFEPVKHMTMSKVLERVKKL